MSRLFPTPPYQLGPNETVSAAVAMMRQHEVGCLVVCDETGLVGILTERDLTRRVFAPGRPMSTLIADVMTSRPTTVSSKESIRSAIDLMEKGGFRHLPVTDEKGRLVGILSIKRIVHYLVEHFPGTVYCQPPDPRSIPLKREGA